MHICTHMYIYMQTHAHACTYACINMYTFMHLTLRKSTHVHDPNPWPTSERLLRETSHASRQRSSPKFGRLCRKVWSAGDPRVYSDMCMVWDHFGRSNTPPAGNMQPKKLWHTMLPGSMATEYCPKERKLLGLKREATVTQTSKSVPRNPQGTKS